MRISTACLFAIAACTASPALAEETWIWSAEPNFGIAWNVTGLEWKFDVVKGTMVYYSPKPVVVPGGSVHWVLEDFTMDCKAKSYLAETVILFGPKRETVDVLLGSDPHTITNESPEYILSAALCDGANLAAGTSEAASRDEAMTRMALVPPQG